MIHELCHILDFFKNCPNSSNSLWYGATPIILPPRQLHTNIQTLLSLLAPHFSVSCRRLPFGYESLILCVLHKQNIRLAFHPDEENGEDRSKDLSQVKCSTI